MHFFTSITTNYLPKARVLASSVKRYCCDAQFSLVVSDRLPTDFDLESEPFDEIVYADQLEIPVDNLDLWVFTHTVVELCTAVKGQALLNFLNKEPESKVVYLDPDTVVFDDLSELETLLDKHAVILTPHLTSPEKSLQAIADNEQCALMHGVYNLGFVAVSHSENGLKFANWWRDRLVEFCYDDIPNGLFTDQRWVDLAPAIFEDIFILRDPNYNVATWNITHRDVTKADGHFLVNGKPLQFYHFSGFDSGAQEAMLARYGADNPALRELREWYIAAQDDAGQQQLGCKSSVYACYDTGETITNEQRRLLRKRQDLREFFGKTNPFLVTSDYVCYYNWFQNEYAALSQDSKDIRIRELECEIKRLRKYLMPLIKIKRLFKKKYR